MSDLRNMNMVDLNVQVLSQCHHCIIGIGALFGKRVLMQQGPSLEQEEGAYWNEGAKLNNNDTSNNFKGINHDRWEFCISLYNN